MSFKGQKVIILTVSTFCTFVITVKKLLENF